MARRSIIIDGAVTSISMEDAFWAELDRAASEEGLSWAVFVRALLTVMPPAENRSGSIREAVLQRLRRQADLALGKHAVWEVHEGETKNTRRIVTNATRIIVGRSLECDLVLLDEEASRRHCLLVHDGVSWRVIDLESKNGTGVDGVAVKVSKVLRGQRITVGCSSLVLMS